MIVLKPLKSIAPHAIMLFTTVDAAEDYLNTHWEADIEGHPGWGPDTNHSIMFFGNVARFEIIETDVIA